MINDRAINKLDQRSTWSTQTYYLLAWMYTKESIEIANAVGATQEARCYGKIGGTQVTMRKALRKLVSLGKSLHFYYETGPCEYELYRYLVSQGHDCWMVAPLTDTSFLVRSE